MAYQLPLGVANAAAVLVLVTLFLALSDNDFVIWGPSDRIRFAGYTIDTWERWAYVMIFSIVSQVSISISENTLSPYITNVVRDHKTQQLTNPLLRGHLVVQLKTSYDWILGILNTSLWVTLQVQFLLVGLLTDLAVSAVMTQRFLNAKKTDVLLPSYA